MDADGRSRIAQAVARAETRTDGEIVCILARECGEYRETPLAWAAALALLVPPLLAALGLWPGALHHGGAGWTSGAAPAPSPVLAVEAYATAQIALFVIAWAVLRLAPIRLALTPGAIKGRRVHKTAAEQFLATGMSTDPARTGVMILGSLAERRVEVLAEPNIHAAVGDAVWAQAVTAVQAGMRRGDLSAGFVDAVGICGDALAAHFPATGEGKPNAMPDDLIEI